MAVFQRSSPSPVIFLLGAFGLLSSPALAQRSASSPSPAVGIRITAPRPLNTRGEWMPADGEDGFLSTTPVVCTADVRVEAEDGEQGAEAEPSEGQTGPPAARASIRWTVTVFRGARPVGELTGVGPSFTFRPMDAALRRGSGPLSVEITAELGPDRRLTPHPKSAIRNPILVDRVRLQQDEVDQLRQEYLDMPGRQLALAPRSAFVDRAACEARIGGLSIGWPDLNRTCRRDGSPYGHILMSDALCEGLRRWQEGLGARGLTITSGYRNPFKQSITNTRRGGREGAPGSIHQYGRAVDVQASLRRDFRDWVQVAWAALDAGADYVETAPEGGWNHVHADWRHEGQGPPLTVKLEIAGRVVDAEGKPVPAARVVGLSDAVGGLTGMPVWEGPNEEGQFVLRTVWRPGRPYRLQASGEVGAVAQTVAVPEGATGLVRLETDLVLAPDQVRAALEHRRPLRLASRGWRAGLSAQRRKARRGARRRW